MAAPNIRKGVVMVYKTYGTESLDHDINMTQEYIHEKFKIGRRELNLIEDELQSVLFNASCHELWTNGERTDDYYYIQPSLDGPPFEVFCVFTDKGATTVVEQYQTKNGRTATPNENDGCEEKGFNLI